MSGWENANAPHRLSGRARQRRTRRVIARDGGICHICGLAGADVADHVLALARGGEDTMGNLRAAHYACNQRKAVTVDRALRPPRNRPREPHPGMVRP